jgi:hypothetical protein
MIGGTVVETIIVPPQIETDTETVEFGREREARVWINVCEHGRECAVFVADTPEARSVSPGDTLWWQGREAFWTPRTKAFSDRALRRIGFSGVSRPALAAALGEEG